MSRDKKVKRSKTGNDVSNSGSGPNLHMDYFLMEEEESKTRDPRDDEAVFRKICSEIQANMKKILEMKLQRRPLADIEKLRVETSLLFLGLKKINRLDKHRLKVAKDAVNEKKQKVDNFHLQLQNLTYEVMHLQKEVTKCMEFRSRDEEIDLVPVEEFRREAPAEVLKRDLTDADPHQLTLARLQWELVQRKELSQKLKGLESLREQYLREIERKRECLSGIQPTLQAVLEAAQPLQADLGLPLQAHQGEHANAQYLSRPLYVLYVQAAAYQHACGDCFEVAMEGSVEESKALLETTQEKQEEYSGESDQEESNAGKRHRRLTRSGTGLSSLAKCLQKHPLTVVITLQHKGYNLQITFTYIIALHIVTVTAKVMEPHGVSSGVSASPVMSPSTILDNLFGDDNGLCSPNPGNHFQLKKNGLEDFSKVVAEVGKAYRWAQHLAGLEFLQGSGSSVVASHEVGRAFVEEFARAIAARFAARVGLYGQLLSLACPNPGAIYNPYTNTALSCDSQECRNYVNILQSSQVASMEPCEDFYEFACGGWTKAVVVPPDEVTASVHTRLLRRVESEIGDMRNSKGTRPLEELLSYVGLPRWPILNRTAKFPTYQILGHMIRELGLDAIVSVRVGLDYYDSDQYLIYITEPAGVVDNPRRVYNLMALRTLEGAIPEVRWTFFLNLILRDVGVSMDLNDHVVVTNPIYLKKLSRLLKVVPSSIVANYLGWRIVQVMGQHAMSRFRQAQFRFDHYRYLLQEPTEVPRQCVRITMRLLGFAVGRLYFDRHVSKASLRYKGVYDMAEELRQAFSVLIDMSRWMDSKTKERALVKLQRLQLNIGFPPWIRSDHELDEYYKELPDLRKEDFFRSVLAATRTYYRILYGRLRRASRANDFGWLPSDPTSSMHYSLVGNYLRLPLEYLQFPFFLVDLPPPINFGALGSVIAQQIVYGFGDLGSLYDENGRLVEWWSRETRQRFLPGVRCLQEQYHAFTNPITGLPLDINTTAETSVADNAGVRIAFKAFRVFQTKFEERYSLYTIPGTEPRTMEQIFFIAYALTRCEVTRKRSIYYHLRPREQIPDRFRTMIPLMNFERFSATFGCKVGTIMNPDQKCLVW